MYIAGRRGRRHLHGGTVTCTEGLAVPGPGGGGRWRAVAGVMVAGALVVAGAVVVSPAVSAAPATGSVVRPGPAAGPSAAGSTVGDAALSWRQPVLADHTRPYVTPSFLEDVSCVAGPLCVGVDVQGNVVTSTDPAGGPSAWKLTSVGTAPLFSVSCASASLCVAGAELNGQGQGSVAVSSHPAGGASAWQVVTVAGLQNVAGMSCPTAALCVGVDTNNQVLVSTDPTGGASAWKVFGVPEVSPGYGMVAVSCPAATLCVAADGAGDVYTSKDPAGGASAWVHTATLFGGAGTGYVGYRGVSCASVTLCLVAGAGSSAAGAASLYAATKPGGGDSSWTPSASSQVTPESVSCSRGPICVTPSYVGTTPGFAVSTKPTEPLSEWGTQTGGDVKYGPANAVSCTGESLCVAVDSGGDVITSAKPAGGFWTVAAADGSTPLTGVSCPSVSLCVAVGDSGVLLTDTEPYKPSSTWKPADVDAALDLTGVSCPSVSLCVAVDGQGDVLTSSSPAGGASAWHATAVTGLAMTAVSCASTLLCVATDGDGDVFTSTNPAGGASAWNRTAVTGSGGGGDVPPPFSAISCTAAPLCVATDGDGDVITSTDPAGGASAWTVSYLGYSSNLTGVSCTSGGTCVATYGSGQVAASSDPAGGSFAWTVAAPVSGSLSGLYGVTCTDAGLCVAVGGWELDGTQPGGAWTSNQIDSTYQVVMSSVDCIATTIGPALCVAVDTDGRVLVGGPPDTYFNWAGYIAHKAGVTFTHVQGTWVQPSVSCPTSGLSTSSVWVGIDDVNTIEQAGTEADCQGKDQPAYYAWYELYPAALVQAPFAVHHGDRMAVEVNFSGGKFSFTLKDETTGKHYSPKPQKWSKAKLASVEWIVEDPDWALGDPLADFGTVRLTGCYATGNSHTGAISDPAWTDEKITMNTGYNASPGAVPSGLTANGTAFSVTFPSG